MGGWGDDAQAIYQTAVYSLRQPPAPLVVRTRPPPGKVEFLELDVDDPYDAIILEQMDRPECIVPIRDKDERTLDELAGATAPAMPMWPERPVLELVGSVIDRRNSLAIVKASRGLDIDSFVLDEAGTPIGTVVDVYGPVTEPRLVIACMKQLNENDVVFVVNGLFSAPSPEELSRRSPGCDASGLNDREVEASDDDDVHPLEAELYGRF